MKQQPVIIIGMHRSGTTLITDLLEKLGLFMGAYQNTMQEARFFFDVNVWLLEHVGGSWITPERVDDLYAHPKAYDQVTNYIEFLARTPRIIRYLGWSNYFQYRTLTNFPVPWGWKDPRTTYTLPLWLRLFPEAKVIHIYRNGVDVAQSIYVRNERVINKLFPRWQQWYRSGLHIFLRNYFPKYNTHMLTLEQAFHLWERYSHRADHHIASLPSERVRTICYEEFLQNPQPILEDLRSFIGLTPSASALQAAITPIDSSRGYAYKLDPNLYRFYEKVKHSSQMVKYGYDETR